jgi:hypothetical protein
VVDWKKPPTEALHDVHVDAALADRHAAEGREAAAHSATGVAYEKLDVEPNSIVRLAIVLVSVTLVVSGAMFGLFRLLQKVEAKGDPPRPPMAIREVGRVPPVPRLQTTPRSDLEAMRAEQRAQIEGYAWVDQNAGTARIPIEEAMRIYVERQAQAQAGAPAAGPVGAAAKAEPGSAAPNDASAPYPPHSSAAGPGSPAAGSAAPAATRSFPPGMSPLSSPAPAHAPEGSH